VKAVLETRCRCRQIADIPPYVDEWRVPMRVEMVILPIEKVQAEEFTPTEVRIFRWRGEYDPKESCRLFREITP